MQDETTKIVDENHVLQQAFLNELDEKFWVSADKLRQQLDAANYKHIVLGLIFLKYISDSFTHQQEKFRRNSPHLEIHSILTALFLILKKSIKKP